MENKKYKIVKRDFITYKGKKLYRIKALRDLFANNRDVNEGDLGGYVEGYHNLSQEGICWIYDDAKVYGNAIVEDDALIENIAEVYGNAIVRNNAKVRDRAKVYGNAIVKDDAWVEGVAEIYGNTVIETGVKIGWSTRVYDNAVVRGNVEVCDNDKVYNNAVIGELKSNTMISETSNNTGVYRFISKFKKLLQWIVESMRF